MIKFPLHILSYWASYSDMKIITVATTEDKPLYLIAYEDSIYSYIYLIDLIALEMIGPVYEKGSIIYLHFSGRGSFGGHKLLDNKEVIFSSSLDEFTLNLEINCDKGTNWNNCTYDEFMGVLINKLYVYDCLNGINPYYFVGISQELKAINTLKSNLDRDIDELLELHSKKYAWSYS